MLSSPIAPDFNIWAAFSNTIELAYWLPTCKIRSVFLCASNDLMAFEIFFTIGFWQ